MAVAGAVLPGIPALPFLALAVRHAARVSPQFDQFVRRQNWMSTLLDHVETPGSLLRLDGQSLAKVLPIVILAAAVVLILHPPLPVMIGLEIGAVAFLCWRATGPLGGLENALEIPAWIRTGREAGARTVRGMASTML